MKRAIPTKLESGRIRRRSLVARALHDLEDAELDTDGAADTKAGLGSAWLERVGEGLTALEHLDDWLSDEQLADVVFAKGA